MGDVHSRSFQLSVSTSLETRFNESSVVSDDCPPILREDGKRLRFLAWLLILVRQKTSWSPTLIAGELCRFLINARKHREIIRLFRLQPYLRIAESHPGLAFKYLVPDYLVRGFTRAQCVSCYLHHYTRLHALLPESVIDKFLQGRIVLHQIFESGSSFAFTMGLPERIDDKEGEMSLDLRVDNRKVCSLSFTIVPGWVVESKTEEIILISHLQGVKGCNAQTRLARKVLCDYSPKAMLLAALQGVANAFEIREIQAVCATMQRSHQESCSAIFRRGYDHFFSKAGMVKTAAGFYSTSIPLTGKPLSAFKGRARSRAKKRREMRQRIQLACEAWLFRTVDRAAPPLSDATISTELTEEM
jgi:uncharacterized protein VirK/YbjX